ncbi:ABC transporter ATP-binding protein [Lipingzhangella sp. LS1_29]|uniref:ABC transporter ATP-binding protein n=1 Tax=Lipingzhangella rawalii TaxID=2055835 RepID=A0ABU2HCN9_9ACTN|nr:ABC transporter ATP-binding protein [Lipingzhangella rawalii]MDS1272570.1 ABC transporter ATP-binding protein [Lipingzhangella rawalii]
MGEVVRERPWHGPGPGAEAGEYSQFGQENGNDLMSAVVRTSGLGKSYGRFRGISDVTMEIERGEVFGFLGPNGAGKTTTIRLLLDLLRPTAGQATIFGLDVHRDGVAVRSRIGYLPGELPDVGRERARNLLEFFAQVHGGVPHQRITDLAERVGLDLDRKVRGLSKGNRQKVGLVQAFMYAPELLILDEPTSGLDPLVQQTFLAMVREAREAGQTVFMSSHVLDEVQQVADRVGIIKDGRLVTVEPVAQLLHHTPRRVHIRFDGPVPTAAFTGLAGVRELSVEGSVVRCVVDGPLDELVRTAARFTVVDLLSTEPDLEEMFLRHYSEESDHAADPAT